MSVRSAEHLSPDYLRARERFLKLAESRGARVVSHPIEARSPGGEELAIDTAYLGPESPESVLALSSGLHGVEGFAGSAIQLRLLDEQLDGLDRPPGLGLLLVHALNPYGFAALRRVNESNVDLNRNFVAHPEGHVPNPGYEELYDAINPDTLDEPEDEARRGRLFAYAAEHGFAKLQEVLTVGQYVHPEGVQFGGQRVEASNRLLREIAVRETRAAARIVWVDLHTGLGPYGEVEMIMETPPDAPDFQRAAAWWGGAVRSTLTGDSVSAAIHGSIEHGLWQSLPDAEVTAIAAEFGTYDPARVFAAMRADNWLHRHGERESEQGRAIKQELVEVFRPDDPAWTKRVQDVAAGLIEAAVAGLREAS